MGDTLTGTSKRAVLERGDFSSLLVELAARGYQVVGPVVRDGAIIYGPLTSVADLPEGWTDEQEAGTYRLRRRGDRALFGYNVGPQSWKSFLFPPMTRIWRAERHPDGFEVVAEGDEPPRYALLGVRPCELQAIAVQDRVFLRGRYVDLEYQARRKQAFIVAVNCGQAGATCFCTSMGGGPKALAGFDLALTEVLDDERHYFLVEPGSARGRELFEALPTHPATPEEIDAAERVIAHAVEGMGRSMDTDGLKALLYRNADNPRWEEVASRCLTCGNCTMVCPTCFCSTIEDVTDLSGSTAERWRKWDSCFTEDFSYLHGGSVRASAKSRYRQWMTHKLATWIDQFGTSGCVGCGRCITWCPVGIDITAEVRAIRESERGASDD